MNRKLNRKLVVIMRCVLFVLGAVVGAAAMWQFLTEYPDKVHGGIVVVFYLASALVLGTVLLLSAKPVLHLAYAAGGLIKKAFGRTRPMDIAGALVGLMIGLLLGFLCEALLSLALDIFALRLVIDIVVGLAGAYVAALVCTRWLSVAEQDAERESGEDAEEPDSAAVPSAGRAAGYLLTASALSSDRIEKLCLGWLNAPVYVLIGSVDALMDGADDPETAAAIKRYRSLSEAGALKTVKAAERESEALSVAGYARGRRLKIIALSASEFDGVKTVRPVLSLDAL